MGLASLLEVDAESAVEEARGHPLRPAVPPLLYLAAGLWGALLACAQTLPYAESAKLACCCALGMVFATLCAIAMHRRKRTALWLLALGVALGGVLGAAHELSLQADERALAEEPSGSHELTAVADSSRSEFGVSCLAEMACSNGRTILVRTLLPEGTNLLCGERFTASTQAYEVSEQSAQRYRAQGAAGTVKAYTDVTPSSEDTLPAALIEFRRVAIATYDPFDGAGAALCKAVLFGARDDLSYEETVFYQDVKTTGLAHLVAVSGSHLVIVAGMVDALLRAVRIPRKLRLALEAVFIALYVVLTGLPISAVRAAVMSAVSLAAPLAHRRSAGPAGLALCVVILLAVDPSCATSVSFQLSASATFGIVAFMPLFGSWLATAVPAVPPCVREVLAMTFAANLITQPLAAAVFSQIPLISPLANLLATPVFAVLCGGGLIATVLGKSQEMLQLHRCRDELAAFDAQGTAKAQLGWRI